MAETRDSGLINSRVRGADQGSTLSPELRQIAKGGGISLFGRASDAALGVVLAPVYSRCLGAGGYGLYALAYTTLTITAMVSTMGLPHALMRFASVSDGQGDIPRTKGVLLGGGGLATATTIAGGVVLAALADKAAQGIFREPQLAPVLGIVAIGVPLIGLATVGGAAGLARRTATPQVVGQLVRRVASVGVFLPLWLAGWGVMGAAWGLVGGAAAAVALTALLCWRLFPDIRRPGVSPTFETTALVAFGCPLVLTQLTEFGLVQANVLVLGARSTSADVGVLRAAMVVAMAGILPLGALSEIFAPVIAHLHARGQRGPLASLFQTVTRWAVMGTFPLMLFAMAQREAVMGIFGQEFSDGGGTLVLLCLGTIVNAVTGSAAWLLIMSGHQWINLANNAFFAGANVCLCWVLAGRYGAVGAAGAAAATLAGAKLARLGQVGLLLRMHPYSWAMLRPIALAGVCSLPFWFWRAQGLAELAGLAVLYGLLFVGLTVALGLSAEDREVVRALRERLRSR